MHSIYALEYQLEHLSHTLWNLIELAGTQSVFTVAYITMFLF